MNSRSNFLHGNWPFSSFRWLQPCLLTLWINSSGNLAIRFAKFLHGNCPHTYFLWSLKDWKTIRFEWEWFFYACNSENCMVSFLFEPSMYSCLTNTLDRPIYIISLLFHAGKHWVYFNTLFRYLFLVQFGQITYYQISLFIATSSIRR